jgi:membrane protein
MISGAGAKTARLRARVSAFRATAGDSAVAANIARARELDLGSSALVLAAQQLLCAIPLLVVLGAVRSRSANFGMQLSHFLGVSARAQRELASAFAGDSQVRSGITVVGIVLLVVFALGVAQAHQRFYELTWRLDHRPRGSWLRRVRWVAGLLAYVVVLDVVARAIGQGPDARAAFIAVCAPLFAIFYWWGQRMLLGGRVAPRSLIPGAAITAIGLTLLLVISPWYVSGQTTATVHQFGPIGVTFVLAGWQLLFSIVVLAGTLAGAAAVSHRQRRPGP